VRVTEVRAEPGPDLARIAGLVALTDFASVYLALGLGLDPATSPHVADLKERMA
jgi:glucose/mannose-6-phosphate isomerase